MKQQILFFLCLCLLCGGVLAVPMWVQARQQTVVAQEEPVVAQIEEDFDTGLSLRVLVGDEVRVMDLREYLKGVVSGELPKDFPVEAVKAQAVAARTFTLRCCQRSKHAQADVCTDSACCQAWTELTNPVACEAVEETDGMVLLYEDELIDATYFSCSGGRTEAAVAVWGGEVPYLQAVDSPGEEGAEPYKDTVELSTQAFGARLQTLKPELILSDKPTQWIGKIRYTQGNGIDTVEICGLLFRGTELRKLLGLRSTNMRFAVTEDSITISTLGYGHRVGMSQSGAKARAEQGSDFREILQHYYQGIKIKRLFQQTEEASYLYN